MDWRYARQGRQGPASRENDPSAILRMGGSGHFLKLGWYDSWVNPADMSIPEPCCGEIWLGEVGTTTTGIAMEGTDAGADLPKPLNSRPRSYLRKVSCLLLG